MNNLPTDRPSQSEWISAMERIGLPLRRVGGEAVGPCPVCAVGDDRFSVRGDGLVHCRWAQECGHGKGEFYPKALRAAELAREPRRDDLPALASGKDAPTGSDRYFNTDGVPVDVVRRGRGPGKEIRRSPQGVTGPWLALGAKPGEPLEGNPVVIAEGEPAAHAIRRAGFAATTWNGGAGQPLDTDWEASLADPDAEVVLWPDADDQGRKAMELLAGQLQAAGFETVRMVVVAGDPDKADADDFGEATIRERIAAAPVYTGARKWRVVSAAEFAGDMPELEWIWEGLLSTVSLNMVAGAPKIGKSTFARNLAVAVAQGDEFLGWKTTKSAVLWVGLDESRRSLKHHLERLADLRRLPTLQIFDVGRISPAELSGALPLEIKRLRRKFPDLPVLVVIDTLRRATGILDTNDHAQCDEAVGYWHDLAEALGICVLMTHHARKGGGDHGEESTGSQAITGGMETVLSIFWKGQDRMLYSNQRDGDPILREDAVWLETDMLTGGIRKGLESDRRALSLDRVFGLASRRGEIAAKDVQVELSCGHTAANKHLRDLVALGRLEISAEAIPGRGGRPAKYRVAGISLADQLRGD